MTGCFRWFVSWIGFGVEGGLLTARFVHYIICLPSPVLLLTLCSCNLIHLVCNSYIQRVNKLCTRVTQSGAFDVTI